MNYEKNESINITYSVWVEYKKTRDIQLRNKIIEAYLYIVSCNIKRMQLINLGNEIEDITNQGVIALINSIDKYDPDRGVQFDSYVSIRVRGAIIDYLRQKDWVPITVRKRVKNFENAYQEFCDENDRSPSDEELADKLSVSVKDITKIRSESQSAGVLLYEELLYENLDELQKNCDSLSYPSPELSLLSDEFKKALAMSIDALEEKERTIISLYYYEGLKIKEIGYIMGFSESRVSQIHTKTLSKLKLKINSYLYS